MFIEVKRSQNSASIASATTYRCLMMPNKFWSITRFRPPKGALHDGVGHLFIFWHHYLFWGWMVKKRPISQQCIKNKKMSQDIFLLQLVLSGWLDWLLRGLRPLRDAFPEAPFCEITKFRTKHHSQTNLCCFFARLVQARRARKQQSLRSFDRRLCAQLCRDDWIRTSDNTPPRRVL